MASATYDPKQKCIYVDMGERVYSLDVAYATRLSQALADAVAIAIMPKSQKRKCSRCKGIMVLTDSWRNYFWDYREWSCTACDHCIREDSPADCDDWEITKEWQKPVPEPCGHEDWIAGVDGCFWCEDCGEFVFQEIIERLPYPTPLPEQVPP